MSDVVKHTAQAAIDTTIAVAIYLSLVIILLTGLSATAKEFQGSFSTIAAKSEAELCAAIVDFANANAMSAIFAKQEFFCTLSKGQLVAKQGDSTVSARLATNPQSVSIFEKLIQVKTNAHYKLE